MTQSQAQKPSRNRLARILINNLDTSIALVLATTFATLSLLSIADVSQVIAGALLVLVLLAVSITRDREDRARLAILVEQVDEDIRAVRAAQEVESRSVTVSPDEEVDLRHLRAIVETLPTIETAKFLALNGRDTFAVIEQVLEHSRCRVRLLLKHPDSVGAVQRLWIEAEAERLQRFLLPRYADQLEVRFYCAPCSLHGRKLEPYLVTVGWYTPRVGDGVEVDGHNNPLVTASLETPEGAALARMFDGLFETLWQAQDTQTLEAVGRRSS